MPAETETVHDGAAAGAVVSGVTAAIGAISDAIKQYGIRSSRVAGSRRKGDSMGRGGGRKGSRGGRGIKKQGRRK